MTSEGHRGAPHAPRGRAGVAARHTRPGTRLVRRAAGCGLAAAALLAGAAWAVFSFWLPHPLNSKTTCLYTGNSVSALTSFARLTGQPVNCGLLYNDTNTTWAEWVRPWFTQPPAADKDWPGWLRANPSVRRVVLSQEMVPDDVPSNWRELGAAGAYDSYARQLAANLVAARMGNAVIRLGHEMNDTLYHDALGNDPAQYGDWAAYWARIARTMRSVPGAHFLFDWNVNAGYRDIPFDSYYPGDGVVDMIGVDIYDAGMPGSPADAAVRWERLDNEPGGLAQIVAFARKHGKPLSFPEWGLVSASDGGLGDDPAYVTGIAGAIRDNDVVYQAYFDRSAGGVMLLQDAPRSLGLWVRYFGPRGLVQGRPWLQSGDEFPASFPLARSLPSGLQPAHWLLASSLLAAGLAAEAAADH
jgi:hypothetical protein